MGVDDFAKNKIPEGIRFAIYLVLGFLTPFSLLNLYALSNIRYMVSYGNNNYALITGIIYLIIGCYAHFRFRNLAKQIGLINKKRKKRLEKFLTFLAFSLWLTFSLPMFVDWVNIGQIIT